MVISSFYQSWQGLENSSVANIEHFQLCHSVVYCHSAFKAWQVITDYWYQSIINIISLVTLLKDIYNLYICLIWIYINSYIFRINIYDFLYQDFLSRFLISLLMVLYIFWHLKLGFYLEWLESNKQILVYFLNFSPLSNF